MAKPTQKGKKTPAPKKAVSSPHGSSRDAEIVEGYLRAKIGTKGYMKYRPGRYESEGTVDVRENARRIGSNLGTPRRELKRLAPATGAARDARNRSYDLRDNPDLARRKAAKARNENRGRK